MGVLPACPRHLVGAPPALHLNRSNTTFATAEAYVGLAGLGVLVVSARLWMCLIGVVSTVAGHRKRYDESYTVTQCEHMGEVARVKFYQLGGEWGQQWRVCTAIVELSLFEGTHRRTVSPLAWQHLHHREVMCMGSMWHHWRDHWQKLHHCHWTTHCCGH